MGFAKAQPKQAFLKVGFYGPPGSGKTFTSLLVAEGLAKQMGKRVAFIDTERGTDFYSQAIASRQIHPDAFDFDAMYTQSLLDTVEAMKSIDLSTYGVVVLDSISHLWDAAIAAYEGKKTSKDGIPIYAWGGIKKPYKNLIRTLVDMDAHVFILGRQKNKFENDEHVGVGMRAEGETEHEPHISCRFEAKRKADGTLGGVLMIVEKDRTGILQGKTIGNPSYATFAPLLPFLGSEQGKSEDPDEVASRDSDLLAAEEKKARDKEVKSAEFYTPLNTKLAAASALESLAPIAAEIEKSKRHMTPEHLEALRTVYATRHKQLAAQIAPKES